jgi:hypothetical protein
MGKLNEIIKNMANLSLDEMTDPHFRHDRDGHGFDDFFDQARVTLRIYLVTVLLGRVRWG